MDSKDTKETREIQVENINDTTSLDVDRFNNEEKNEKAPGALDESLNDWDAEEERKLVQVP